MLLIRVELYEMWQKCPSHLIKVAHEALLHVTAHNSLLDDKGHNKTRYERFGLTVPKWSIDGKLRTFGKAGVMKYGKKRKLGDHGIPMVFNKYPDNHSVDYNHMWNPQKGKVVETHDLIWLHCMYYENDVSL